LAQQHKIHPDQITAWKQQLLERAGDVVANGHAAGLASRSVWTARVVRSTIAFIERRWRGVKYEEVYEVYFGKAEMRQAA
jgi:hypothetical protein